MQDLTDILFAVFRNLLVINLLLSFNGDILIREKGEMLNQNMQIGDGTNIAGDKNSVNESRTVEMFLKEIAAQRRLAEKKDEQIEKKDEQINRLISLLEKYTEK